jgi:hypothetical protein
MPVLRAVDHVHKTDIVCLCVFAYSLRTVMSILTKPSMLTSWNLEEILEWSELLKVS